MLSSFPDSFGSSFCAQYVPSWRGCELPVSGLLLSWVVSGLSGVNFLLNQAQTKVEILKLLIIWVNNTFKIVVKDFRNDGQMFEE